MKKLNLILSGILLLSFAACAPAVQTDVAADANFGTYETYAMLPSGENTQDNTIYTEQIIEQVNKEMRARGYELDPNNPDLLVNVKSMYEEEEELVSTGYYPATYDYYTPGFYTPTTMAPYYYTGYATVPRVTGAGIREVEYIQGTFVVDVIEAQGKNNIIWRGWSDTPVDPANLDESVQDYVENIFDEYPVEEKDDD